MNKDIDVTIVSSVLAADGIGSQGIGLANIIHNELSINFRKVGQISYKGISPELLKYLIKNFDGFGKVCFHTSILGLNEKDILLHQSIDSKLKISYSMIESDKLVPFWVDILNKYYDMVVVPDIFLVDVYSKSGVKIPIFVVPLGINIDNLLVEPFKEKPGDPFVFGCSSGYWSRKNHIKVVQAFAKTFGNNNKFKLNLHGRFGPFQKEVEKAVQESNISNIELISGSLSREDYNNFMKKIDCYVFVSGGEGFSITPRECLALGKPCILSNNTAHKTLCNSGFVIPIAADKKVPAVYEVFKQTIGHFYDCSVDELSKTMKIVASNYNKYLEQARPGREYVKQWQWSNLKDQYLQMLKPTNIVSGKYNFITKDEFQTNNNKLLEKLLNLGF